MRTPVPSWRYSLVPLSISMILARVLAGLSLAAPTETLWSRPLKLAAAVNPNSQRLALDGASGDLFVTWTDEGMAGRREIFGRRWDQVGGTWTGVENLSLSEWEDRSPLLFFDSGGQGLLIWTRRYAQHEGAPADGTDLVWRAWDGAGWSAEQVLLHRDHFLPGTYGLIATETLDTILLFITFNNGYRTTEYRDGGWSELSPWEYLRFQSPTVNPFLAQVLWDDGGVLHAAAFGENSSQLGMDHYFYDAYYLSYDGSEWSTPLNLSFTDGVASEVGMTFDGQGRLHFLWSDPDSFYSSESTRSAIWERVYDDGAWSPANTQVTTYNENQAIAGFSFTSDMSGSLHLAWSEGIIVGLGHEDLEIYYQTGDGTAWGPEEQVYTSTNPSRFPSLVASCDGAALTWQEDTDPDESGYFSRQVYPPSQRYQRHLPLISKETP